MYISEALLWSGYFTIQNPATLSLHYGICCIQNNETAAVIGVKREHNSFGTVCCWRWRRRRPSPETFRVWLTTFLSTHGRIPGHTTTLTASFTPRSVHGSSQYFYFRQGGHVFSLFACLFVSWITRKPLRRFSQDQV